jgi:DNA-directed RNA polymerase specialized sigma24 family protein
MEADERASLRADLARLADGDRTALEPAFARLHPLVFRFCKRVLDAPTAEDASQEALVNLFAHMGEYDSTRDPVPWALAFAANACRTSRKRVIRCREQGDVPEMSDDAEPDSPLIEAELRAAVTATLSTLSSSHPIDFHR